MVSFRFLSVLLTGVAFAALLSLQFLSWANVHLEGGSTPSQSYFGVTVPGSSWPDSTTKATTWNVEWHAGRTHSDEGWYSNDLEDDGDDADNTGLTMVRVAVPLLLTGLVA